jgi:hypothetical protein
MAERFTAELWDGAADIYRAILAHPFLTGLTDGTLPQDAFAFYVVQDRLYLQRYAHALAAVAARAPGAAATQMFASHAAGVVAVEQTLHRTLLASLGGRRRRTALLLDLLGDRQGTRPPRFTRPALPAMDRHLRRRAVRPHCPGRARRDRPARPAPVPRRTHPGAPALPDHRPLRMDVLGHGLP